VPTSRLGEHTSIPKSAHTPVILSSVLLTLGGLAVASPHVLMVAALDAASAAILVVPPMLVGLWLIPIFNFGRLPLRWHLLLGAALGLGTTSLLVLLLGLIGVLQRSFWIGLLGLFMVLGIIRLRVLLTPAANANDIEGNDGRHGQSGASRWLWLILVPFLILALLAAANAPGFIWAEEGQGYDALEYHLGMPKEYLQAGRIAYAPHNVYANFPMNVEMLYLLAMIVHHNIYDMGTTANMIHLMLGALSVFAVWVAGREWSPMAGQVSAIAMGTVGWLGYLSGLAYVEHGMLFFSAVAVAALLRATSQSNNSKSMKWLALSGVCSGFACGCKYTAVGLIVLPITTAIVLFYAWSWHRPIARLAVYSLGTTLAFAPWLVKNTIMTGNPVFPLANTAIGGNPPEWSEDETRRWDSGHAPLESDRAFGARLRAFWRHVPADRDQRFGPAIILLALLGLFGRRFEGHDVLLITIFVIQALIWLFATHLFARFAVPFLIPLGILAGRALLTGESRRRIWIGHGVLLAGAAWSLVFAARLHAREAPGGAPASLIYEGTLPGSEYYATINQELPPNARVLLVGDARAFYFQRPVNYWVVFMRSPFVKVVESALQPNDIMQWLCDQGYTHVLVHWHEVARLRRTYGFSPKITPDLFDRLASAGLSRIREFHHPDVNGRWVDLYEVPSTLHPMSNRPEIGE